MSTDATVTLTWDAITEADNPYLYLIYRKKEGSPTWTRIAQVDATPDGKNGDNPNWSVPNTEYFYNDTLIASKFCGDDIVYSYAIVVIDANKNASGNPKDASWDWARTATHVPQAVQRLELLLKVALQSFVRGPRC